MRAYVLGDSPATVLAAPVTLLVSGPAGSARIELSGSPSMWLTAINAHTGTTGVEALLTTAATRLEDGFQPDPLDEGFLLLYSRRRGTSAQISAGVERVVDGFGFSVSYSHGRGRDTVPGLKGTAP